MTEITRALPSDAGCWIDGHWGQYAVARMVAMAESYGYVDEIVAGIAHRHLYECEHPGTASDFTS